MKTVDWWLLGLAFGLYATQGSSAERLVGISEETAPPVEEIQPAEQSGGGISYRVICSPEGEVLPECGQPPIRDSWAAEPSKAVEPDTPVASDSAEQPVPQVEQAGKAVEASKKKTSSKKRPQKTAKKSGKKAAKTAKKRR